MRSFEYSWPVKVCFGEGILEESLKKELQNYGKNIMLAYGGGSIIKNGIYDRVVKVLKEVNKTIVELKDITANPTYAKVKEGIELYRENNVDLILAVGGGSVIDCCKIITAGIYEEDDLWDAQMNQHRIASKKGNFACIVTMSGAGAEMDCLGACSNEELHLKRTFVGSFAKFVILDPECIMSVPLHVFMPGVYDSLSHCMETFFGNVTNVHDEMNIGLMRNIVRNMRELINGNDNIEVRSDLMWDASLIQMFLLNAGKPGDFQAHQMENLLCAHSHGTHGTQLAIIQPVYYRYIYQFGLEKFAWFAKAVFDVNTDEKTNEEVALEGLNQLQQLITDTKLPSTIKETGYDLTDEVIEVVANNFNASAGSYKPLTKEEVIQILKECR